MPLLTTLPTPITDALAKQLEDARYVETLSDTFDAMREHACEMERDAMALALRRYSEKADTFSP